MIVTTNECLHFGYATTNLADLVVVVASEDSSSHVLDHLCATFRVPVAWLNAATIVCTALNMVLMTDVRSQPLGWFVC